MNGRKALVTGGAGYIGSHLVDELVRRGYRVTVLDLLVPQVHPTGTWPDYVNPDAEYIQGDVRDRDLLAPLACDAEVVVHFAAAVSVGQSMYQIDHYTDINTRGTALVLDILANEKNRAEKLIVASSVGVYGEGAYECQDCGPQAPTLRPEAQLARKDWEPRCPACNASLQPIPTPEDKPLYRDNIYAQTKYHQEEMALLVGRTYGIPTVTPRFFNVYGPRQSISNPYAGVAAIFLSRLLNDKQPVVFEDGGQLRDFVSVRDVVQCLMLMIEKDGADYLPVNIGAGMRISVIEIARTLARLVSKELEPEVLDTGRKFDIRHCFADISRAQETLGFDPRVSFEDGMSELIGWATSHSDQAVDLFDQAMGELEAKNLLVKETGD